MGWVAKATPRLFHPWENLVPIVQEAGWAQGRSGRVRKISPPPGFDPRIVQPVASRYTDWAIPAHKTHKHTHTHTHIYIYICILQLCKIWTRNRITGSLKEASALRQCPAISAVPSKPPCWLNSPSRAAVPGTWRKNNSCAHDHVKLHVKWGLRRDEKQTWRILKNVRQWWFVQRKCMRFFSLCFESRPRCFPESTTSRVSWQSV